MAGSVALAEWIASEMPPVKEESGGRGGGVSAVFQRMFRIFQSVTALPGPDGYEAAAALAALLFERYVDLELLAGDASGKMPRLYREFAGIQKFRAAHRLVEFKESRGGESALDAGEQIRFKDLTGGIEEIRKRVVETWGADNRGKGSYPVHWSGRKCTRQLCRDLGAGHEELYLEAYCILSWLLNVGFSMGGEPDAVLREEIFHWCHGISQLVMLEGARALLDTFGEKERRPWLDRAIVFLRNNPGAALAAEEVDSQ